MQFLAQFSRSAHQSCRWRGAFMRHADLSRFRIVSPARRPGAARPSRRDRPQPVSFRPEGAAAAFAMKNGLYSVHTYMLDGVKGRDSGVLVLRDGAFLGGGPYFWSTGSYTVADGTW